MKYSNWVAKIQTPVEEERNLQVTESEILEMRKLNVGKKMPLHQHKQENRSTRRRGEQLGVTNNRSNPTKRDRVRIKMALFAMSVNDKLIKAGKLEY